MNAAVAESIAENGPASEPGASAAGPAPGAWKYCSAKIAVAPDWSAWKPTCGSWLIAAPGPTRNAQADPALAHSTLISAGWPDPSAPVIEVSAVQCAPPSAVRYSSPSAPSQPCRGSLKQTVCALAGVAMVCQVRPPSAVVSTTPSTAGVSGSAPPA